MMFKWDDKNIATLRVMRVAGDSSKAIAKALGTTKGSVIGKANRLKIKTPNKPCGANEGVYAALFSKRRVQQRLKTQTTAYGTLKTLKDVSSNECLFPVSKKNGEHLFCCAKREGRVYCEKHTRLAGRG